MVEKIVVARLRFGVFVFLWSRSDLGNFRFRRSGNIDTICIDTVAQWRRCWFRLLLFCDHDFGRLCWRPRRFGRGKQER